MNFSPLPIWVVYDHPKDYPDCYIARRWQGETPTDEVLLDSDLDRLRDHLERQGLVMLKRAPSDDPSILETWL